MLNYRQTLNVVYNIAMTRYFKLLILAIFLITTVQASQAEEYNVLVLPDTIQFERTNYVIYPDAATMFASDTINEIKKNGAIETVSMTTVRDALRKNPRLTTLTKKAIREFKYNYNIPFVDFKEIARCFSTNKVLIITSQTDAQNYFLRRTLWDFLDIPGATVIDPAYKLSTYAALIDVDKEQVLWQKTYYKMISSRENRIIAQTFAPATEQLEKIKSYSQNKLAPEISLAVRTAILPPVIPGQETSPIVNVSNFKPYVQQDDFSDDIKPKFIIPSRTKRNNYGMMINDL